MGGRFRVGKILVHVAGRFEDPEPWQIVRIRRREVLNHDHEFGLGPHVGDASEGIVKSGFSLVENRGPGER